MLTISMPIST